MQPQRQKITGTVTQADLSPGSKSEHRGVILRTARGDEFILRRAGGNAFRDAVLERLVGKAITATGLLSGSNFIMDGWDDA